MTRSKVNASHYNRREFIAAGTAASGFFLGGRTLAQSSNPSNMDIVQASRLIRSGDLSPTDTVRSYLEQIEKINPRLNAYITVMKELALERAEFLEAELANGKWRGPLHGMPIALKDNIDTVGVRTTAASAVYQDRVPDEDAEVVRRLEGAGAIILGKLNMHEFAYGASSAISYFGPVRNPWDPDRIPGGSSGGSGAAVAARMCVAALGTDTGGSIRTPAAHCGIVGLKPTYGLTSIRGIIPLGVSQDHVGPMCRTVADAALMLQAMVGYDPRDVASIKADNEDYSSALRRPTSALRIGIPRTMFYENVDAQILDAVERAITLLSKLTGSTKNVDLPPIPETGTTFVEAFEYHENLIEEKREMYGSLTLERILRGADVSATDFVAARHQLTLARKGIARVFDEVDLLVTPTVPHLPIRIEDALKSPPARDLIRNNFPFNIYGIPAISIPCGFSRDGLPIGLQICGRALGEVDVLALAHAYEQRTDWHERIPSLAQTNNA
jgi:aspartyl-tRNA(Asn)/glutamyl-tRNA(Gln) amidotransferase subunit A